LNTAPVGTFITYTYASSTNTRTQTTTAPTQTTSDMNVNGIQLFSRAYNTASTAASPSTVAIQIGKGLKGVAPVIYKSIGKAISGTLDFYLNSAAEFGALIGNSYNESTGILLIDLGYRASSTNTLATINYNDLSQQTSGYVVINGSTNPALTGMNVVIPRIATLKDVQPSGTNGGTAGAATTQTRVLNTLDDPTGIVTSLASNQFTLPAGQYIIEASASSILVSGSKLRLRNITDTATAILGTSRLFKCFSIYQNFLTRYCHNRIS
jgi:hypothetical protein